MRVEGAGDVRMRLALATGTTILSVCLFAPFSPSQGADLEWRVQNPFRFFKKPAAFAMHEKAFEGARGKADGAMPANIVWRTERALNKTHPPHHKHRPHTTR